MKNFFTLRDLPVAERPRERLEKYGAEALSAQELLALVLGRGVRGESVMMTVQRLLSAFGSLGGVMDASLQDLRKHKGIGIAKAGQIKACLEIARRSAAQKAAVQDTPNKKDGRVCSPREVYAIVQNKLREYAKEHFFVLSFDARNKFLGMDTVSVGTLNASLVHPREAFESAIRRHADHIVIAHNHPSGDPDPSNEDVEVTKRLFNGGNILGIELVDHVIVTKTGYKSFKEQGLL
ncbi:MAG: DNA repair protein RadC [Candidatus Wildermuthbacteria bacterium]|nr:DNA repair protein RadC [Candidatus Wildermuthbacteria bacterium]